MPMRSGFISLIGRTNAGKSSLVNYLLNTKITMVSHKINATRRKINAIVMHAGDQAIFVDTPGLNSSQKTMNRLMNDSALNSAKDCDLALFVADIFDDTSEYERFLAQKIPHVVALSKIDKASKGQIYDKLTQYARFGGEFKAIVPFSVKKNAYRKILLDEICKHLPEHDYYYDPQYLTTTNQKEIYRDFILEAIFENVSDEIPYSTDVEVEKVIEKDDICEIYANIIAENNHKKGILISSIKRIGINARKLISSLNESKVFIKLNVIVSKNWTRDEEAVKKFIF